MPEESPTRIQEPVMSFHEHENLNPTFNINDAGIDGTEIRGAADQAMLMTFNNFHP